MASLRNEHKFGVDPDSYALDPADKIGKWFQAASRVAAPAEEAVNAVTPVQEHLAILAACQLQTQAPVRALATMAHGIAVPAWRRHQLQADLGSIVIGAVYLVLTVAD